MAVVDKTVDRRGTRDIAEAYLNFLYSKTGQEIVAKHYFRPTLPEISAKYKNQHPPLTLFTVNEVAGSWAQAQAKHFDDGGVFDKIYQPAGK